MKLLRNLRPVSLLLILITCATVAILRAQDAKPPVPLTNQRPGTNDPKPQLHSPTPVLSGGVLPNSSLADADPFGSPQSDTTTLPPEDPFADPNSAQTPKASDDPFANPRTEFVLSGSVDTVSQRSYSTDEINQIIADAEAQARIDRNGEPQPAEPTAELHLPTDEPYNNVKSLIESVKQLGINRIILSRVLPNDANPFPVLIVCHPDISWRRVREIESFLRTHTKYKVEVRVSDSGPITSTLPALPNAVTTSAPNITPTKHWFTPDKNAPKVKVRFAGLTGAAIGWENKQQRWANNQLTVPATYEFAVGNTYRIKAQVDPQSSAALFTLLHIFPIAANYPDKPIVFEINRLMTHALQNGNYRQVIYVKSGSPELEFEMTDYQHGRRTDYAIEQIQSSGNVLAIISVGRYDATNLYWPSPVSSDNSPLAIGPYDMGLRPNDPDGPLMRYDYSPQTHIPSVSDGGYGPFPTQNPINPTQPNPRDYDLFKHNVVDFRKKYEELDQQSQQLAARLREPQLDASTADNLKTQLLDTVSKSFAIKQSMHLIELNSFSNRLDTLKKSIENREAHRKQIIERRVEELLDPNLNWQPSDAIKENFQVSPVLR